jgi:acyl transferase domain-containing protein/NAD(P)-dependent dehydrogenase (short-subunit alcohol dehydrogenase family)/acyl carrier protein
MTETTPGPAANPALARALAAIRSLRAQLAERAEEPAIAVVGAGLRLPGGIETLDGYWEALADGRDLVGPMPAGRQRPDPAAWAGLPRRGGFLDEVMEFDAPYFGVSPREAAALDPQHRLLLEVAVEALEHAALPPDRLAAAGQRVGLYVGITGADYREQMDGEPSAYWATGSGLCFAVGRVAYALGLSGPAVATDSACSSSLVALHLARRALAAGECDTALAGGVNLILSARSMGLLATTGAISPDGSCKPFDARANGFARGEGCGLVVLRRLADARRDGDRILGVIRGSAINHDGRSTGFTVPNVRSQIALTRATLADAGLAPADIGLVETHGTGTSLGDPIEMDALITALDRRDGGAQLPIGSVKANLGHLEAAAGVAGVIKALLCLRHQAVPPLVHFRTLNPRIDLTGTNITVPTALEPWPQPAGQHVVVSSFGMSGTNAQVLVGPAEAGDRPAPGDAGAPAAGFELAAESPEALRALAGRFATRLSELADDRYPAFAYTATYGRTRHRFRAQVTAADRTGAFDALRALAEGRTSDAVELRERDRSVDGAPPPPRELVDLPHYPWQRRRYPALETAPPAGPAPLYDLAWAAADLGPQVADAPPTAVIAGDDQELVGLLKAQAEAAGVTVVEPGSAQYGARGAALILAPRATPLPETPDGDPAAAGASLCAQVAEAVARAAAIGTGRVSVLTRGARQATGHDRILASDHGLLHGLAPVLGLEHPGTWGAVIDLPAEPAAADAAAALRLACRLEDGAPDLLAVRDGSALAATLAAVGPAPPAGPLRADATYLVTGALGGVGRAVTASLVERGARHLLLLGRRAETELDEAGAALLGTLRADGVEACYRSADCADPAALAAACAALADLPPVHGVVHAAGTLGHTPQTGAAPADFAEAAGAKFAGAWWLHLLARDWPLDFFVTVSSVSALWGLAGYGPYAAANGGLDLIAAHRVATGSTAASVAFGPWALDGMAGGGERERLARIGLAALPPRSGCAALAAHAPGRAGYTVAVEADWPGFAAAMDALRRRPLFDRLARGSADGPAGVYAAAAPTAPGPDVSGLSVPDAVAAITAAVLGHADPAQVRRDTGFQDLGLDSIMAVDLARALTAAFGRTVLVTDLFDHPTITALAEHIALPAAGRSLAPAAEPVPLRAPAAAAAAALQPAAGEPIAIIGLAGRFPGADSAEEFWELLGSGRDAVGPVPAGRWDARTDGAGGGADGGFLSDVARFDAAFFGLSARETHSLDPQHRLLLEASWHALEDAGIDPRGLKGSRTGVFVGISNADFARLLEDGGTEALDAHFATGNALNAAAGRVSFLLGLRGPALAVDTACSSSLVALHLAVRSLRAGETDCAIVGGVNVLAGPTASVAVGRAHMLSPTGRCRTFSDEADGFVRSEGCGVVVLKRLTDARRDRDRVQATVLGTAVNQDGASSALTAPNGTAQTEVIAEALADARVPGSAVSYLEAHGTGTALGDPIEVEAALRALGPGRPAHEPLLLGSVKSVIGHCESAAGIAGVIKTVLALRHGTLPPGLHCERLNPHVPWSELNARVVGEPTAWTGADRPRIAGISSFGFTGTNAHAVLGEPPRPQDPDPPREQADGPVLLPLSAADPAGLTRVAHAWRARLEGVAAETRTTGADTAAETATLAALASTAATGRAHLPARRALLGRTPAELLENLAGPAPAAPAAGGRPPRILFLLPGQGSQYLGMGRRLYAAEPVFRAALDACAAAVGDRLGAPLTELMFAGPDPAAIDQTHITQPALVAVELALAELWRSWGVTPAAVLGHSVGEISAAALAGVLDTEAAMRLVVERGRLMQGTEPGAMLAVSARPEQVAQWLEGRELDLAADNGPAAATVAGRAEAVEEFAAWLADRSVRARRLTVSRAFHSRLMSEAMLDELRKSLAGYAFGAPKLPVLGNLTGTVADAGTYDAEYWARHVRNPVLFRAAAARIPELEIDLCLEVGPGRALGSLIRGADLAPARGVLASLPAPGQDRAGLLAAAKGLYEAGQDLAWAAVQRGSGAAGTRAPAPRYPFAGAAHWPAAPGRRRPAAAGPHWGRELRSPALAGRVFEFERSETFPAHQTDHRLYGTVVTPGASHLATILSALAGGGRPFTIDDLIFHRPQVIAEGASRPTQLILDGTEISIHSRTGADAERWVTHLTARTGPEPEPGRFPLPDRAAFIARADRHIKGADLYRRTSDLGYTHGPSFQWVTDIWIRGEEALLRYRRPPLPDDLSDYEFHTGLIDSFLQGLAVFEIPADGTRPEPTDSIAVPFAATRLSFPARPAPDDELWGHVQALDAGPSPDGTLQVDRADLRVADADGRVVFAADGFRFRRAARAMIEADLRANTGHAYEQVWTERPPAPEAQAAEPVRGAVVVYGAEEGFAAELGLRCAELGLRARALPAGRPVPAAALVLDGRFLAAGSGPERARDASVELAATLAAAPPGTRYAVVCEGGPQSAPLRESLWGMLAALEAEQAERRLMRVTLDTGWTPATLARALAENLAEERFEPRLRVGAGPAQVARLLPVPSEADPTRRAGGGVLITGGLGALGLSVLRIVAGEGAEAVTLLGRSGPGPAAQAAIDEVRSAGVPVTVLAGDVTDPDVCAGAVAEAGRHAPLRRVFHLAGALRDRAFAGLTAEDFEQVYAGKAVGADALAAALRPLRDLEAFVLFSSASSVLGAPGQVNYAAANGYLNGLAQQLRAEGVPAVSIAWGPWIPAAAGGGGMADAAEVARAGARRGVRPLTDEEAAEILALAQQRPDPGLLAVAADFDQYAEHLGPRPGVRLVQGLISAQAKPADQAGEQAGPRGWLREQLDAHDPAARSETLRGAIRTALRDVLGGTGEIDDELAFAGLGLDSITMIDLRTLLAQALDADLPATMAVDHPSVAQLAAFILGSGLVDSR